MTCKPATFNLGAGIGRLGMDVQMIVIRTTATTAGGREAGRGGRRQGGKEGGREGGKEGGREGDREGGGGREVVRTIVRNAGSERQSYDVLV